MAILANTVILVSGFLVLMLAAFKPTVDMGLLTALSMIFALILDFLLLPVLLLWTSGSKAQSLSEKQEGVIHAT
jgi:predicted RND superfamily exporter protein